MIDDAFISDSTKINHDLNFLYLIARTVLPKDVLETLMYGSDFDEPTIEDIDSIIDLIEANETKIKKELWEKAVEANKEKLKEDDKGEYNTLTCQDCGKEHKIDDFNCPVCGGDH